MVQTLEGGSPEDIRSVQLVQAITIGWMCIEAGVSVWAAARAKSPALPAFGGDSAIELLSAAVVWHQFRTQISDEKAEPRAARIAGVLLLILAALVTVASILALLGYAEPQPSVPGVALLVVAALLMPWLARQKRLLSSSTGSAALRADAAEFLLCACLSIIALVGVAIRALAGFASGPRCRALDPPFGPA